MISTLLLKNKNIDELICFISYNDPINDSKGIIKIKIFL